MKQIYLMIVFLGAFISSLQAKDFQFNPTAGPPGAIINDIYFDGEVLYAAGGHFGVGGIYISTNMGGSWSLSVSKFNNNYNYYSLAGNGNAVYAGTYGILRTLDNGKTWHDFNKGLRNEDGHIISGIISNIEIVEGKVIASNQGGLLILSDETEEWLFNPVPSMKKLEDFTYHKGRIFAAMNSAGIYYTEDFGMTWIKSDNGIPGQNMALRSIYSDGNILIAGNLTTIHYSTNDGEHWNISQISDNNSGPEHISSDGENFYCSVNKTVYKSVDDGKTWDSVLTTKRFSGPGVIRFFNNKLMLAEIPDGILVSEDGGLNWEDKSYGLANMTTMDVYHANEGIMAAVSIADFGYPWISFDKGLTWSGSHDGLSAIGVHAVTWKDGIWFAGTNGGGVHLSSNNGETWEYTGGGVILSGYMSDFAVTDNYVYAATEGFNQGTFRTSDLGKSWESVDESLPKSNIYDFLVKGNTIYAAIANLDGVYRSTDEGDNWEKIYDSMKSSLHVTSLEKDDEYIYLGTLINGLLRSSDNGNSWNNVENELSGKTINDLYIVDDILFAAMKDDGVYFSRDKGLSWLQIPGLPGMESIMKLTDDGEFLYAASLRYGVWKADLNMATSVENDNMNSNVLHLYPNPTIRDINLELNHLKKPDMITISDITGKIVKTLFIDDRSESLSIDLMNLKNGSYLMSLYHNDEIISSEKFIIQK